MGKFGVWNPFEVSVKRKMKMNDLAATSEVSKHRLLYSGFFTAASGGEWARTKRFNIPSRIVWNSRCQGENGAVETGL